MPAWALPIFLFALLLILLSVGDLLFLAVSALRERHLQTPPGRHRLREDDFLWVFLVPALNEEVTIADSVERLGRVRVSNKVILVINDGSEDRTGEILAGLDVPELRVLTRTLPEARQGKSEALNQAWCYLHREVLVEPKWADWPTDRVLVGIVDADGRLDEEVGRLAAHFADPKLAGIQCLVRMYNRDSILTYCQDLEFAIFGSLFQLGRARHGVANMGGNGQVNRLAALDELVEEGQTGPWRAARLTEDQDIGLRLIERGWYGAQSLSVAVHQQALHSLRALYRQRTRWAQGAWQSLSHLSTVRTNHHLRLVDRLDQVAYLLTPFIQAVVGVSLVLSVIFLLTGTVTIQVSLVPVVLFVVFSFGPGIIGLLVSRRGTSVFKTIWLALLYLGYTWLIYPVVFQGLWRELRGHRTWAKTAREQLT